MALTWADLIGPLKELAGLSRDEAARILTAATARQAWPSVGSAVATDEYVNLEQAGSSVYASQISAFASTADAVQAALDGWWLPFAARYIRDNDTGYDGIAPTWADLAQAINEALAADDEDFDASVPTAGTVRYGTSNQGDGTATVAINSDTTLAELALAGVVELRCIAAGFSLQNAERWQLTWRGVNPRTGQITARTSQTSLGARGLRTGTRYFDVAASSYPGVGLSPSAIHQIPQRGGNIHTGLNILISAPTYTPTESSGDVDLVMSAVSVNLVDGAKSNLSRRNTSLVSGTPTFYLRIVKDGANYSFTWYQDAAFTVALTETLVLTTAAGTATQTWKAASTNPEVFLPGGHLSTSSNFISATVAAGSLTQSATVVYTANLPWAVGDTITQDITNSYAGVLSRFFVEELGFAVRVVADGTETIADP